MYDPFLILGLHIPYNASYRQPHCIHQYDWDPLPEILLQQPFPFLHSRSSLLHNFPTFADRENRADEVAGKKATDKDHLLQQVLFDLVQTDTIKNSLTLGSHILKKIKPVHKLHSRNTEQAAFVVLKSPSIPSVLVETSFITNPNEEKLLGTTAFRQKIATAIANGIISYFHWFDNQKAHSKRR